MDSSNSRLEQRRPLPGLETTTDCQKPSDTLRRPITRCVGNRLALFFFAVVGNLCYAGSIIAKSTDKKYLMINAPWLAGSLLTVFLDFTVLGQFLYYRSLYVARRRAGAS
ncbi:PQ-loop-domain-containing protein [Mycena sanguinolenta]|uniref:PQ-loop-domain-containing protein n=1 Tax=Mycena sanguinolenta TaxID=230812 RepID=A0A8H7CT22_9AGAR|nr:PQ-loop-domain-containing protein [Mycena sanguinolenta]